MHDREGSPLSGSDLDELQYRLHRRSLLQKTFVAGLGASVFGSAATAMATAATPKKAAPPVKLRNKVVLVQPGPAASFDVDAPTFVNTFQACVNCFDMLVDVDIPTDVVKAAAVLKTKGLPIK